MRDYKTLTVWQKAHQLVLAVYRATAQLPKEELYGLTSQIRRAAASIPANIAEGCGRYTDADFARFVQIALGSANEVEYHLLLAYDLGFIKDDIHQNLSKDADEIRRMLIGLIQKLRQSEKL